MLRLNKRGVSVIIGYVLLVSMAVALSVLVYNAIMLSIPGEAIEGCPDGAGLSIVDVRCDKVSRTLNFSVKNTGLFDVDGFVAKVNDKEGSTIGIADLNESSEEILTGDKKDYYNNYVDLVLMGSDLKLLELQPFVSEDGEKSL